MVRLVSFEQEVESVLFVGKPLLLVGCKLSIITELYFTLFFINSYNLFLPGEGDAMGTM